MAKERQSRKEKGTLEEVLAHYSMAKLDLDARIPVWDKRDELYRSQIKEQGWPFQSEVFDPRIFTILTEKTARLIAAKPRGKVFPREGTDVGSARVINELLSFQWDNARHDGPMLEKWALMDQRTRKYGAAFGLCRWWHEERVVKENKSPTKKIFDSPEFIPINPKNALPDPNATSIENCRWFQVRSYPTLNDLRQVNDVARGEPIYNEKALEILGERIEEIPPASTSSDYRNMDRILSKLTDQSGLDPTYRPIRIVTEYRPDRWVTFAPDYSVILRDIPNPYEHFEIPVVMLRYLPTGNDIYGLSEIEPIEKLQRALNAVINQYLDSAILDLYPPLIINPAGVKNYLALEWGPGKPWLATNPAGDIKRLESSSGQTISTFTNTYSYLVAALMEAAGESSLGVSNIRPFTPGKTATEVQALAIERNVRDSYNMLYLSQALSRQSRLWFLMSKQFIKKPEVIRIVGRDAIASFNKEPFINLGNVPVRLGNGQTVSKLALQEDLAFLAVEPEDLDGDFDFIYDQEPFALPREGERREAQRLAIELLVNNPNVQALLTQEGFSPKVKDLIVELLEGVGLKDAEQFFKAAQAQQVAPQAGTAQGTGFAVPTTQTTVPTAVGGLV